MFGKLSTQIHVKQLFTPIHTEATSTNTYPDLAALWTSLMLIGPDRFLDNAVGIMGTALTGVSLKPTLGYTNDKVSWNIAADEGLACQLPLICSETKWFKSTGLFAWQQLFTSCSTQTTFILINTTKHYTRRSPALCVWAWPSPWTERVKVAKSNNNNHLNGPLSQYTILIVFKFITITPNLQKENVKNFRTKTHTSFILA